MIKTNLIIFALITLSASQHSSLLNPCGIPCPELQRYDGSGEAAVKVDGHVNLAFDPEKKLFVITNNRVDVALILRERKVFVLNTKIGAYIVIDMQTKFAVMDKFHGMGRQTNLLRRIMTLINNIHSKYGTINNSTEGNFDFSRILNSYYKQQFDLKLIVPTEIALDLQTPFSRLFELLKTHVRSGSALASEGLWGFLAIWTGLSNDIAFGIFDVLRIPIDLHIATPVELYVNIIKSISLSTKNLALFSTAFSDVITTSKTGSLLEAIKLAYMPEYNPVDTDLNFKGIFYKFKISNIASALVLRVSLPSGFSISKNEIKIIYLNKVLIMINMNTGIVVSLFEQSIFINHFLCPYGLIVTNGGISGEFVIESESSSLIQAEKFLPFTHKISVFLKLHKASAKFQFSELYDASKSGKNSEISKFIRAENAADFQTFFKNFFLQSDGNLNTFGSIAIGVLGNRLLPISHSWSSSFTLVAATEQDWKRFLGIIGALK